jgi:hypothetical protein
VLIRRLETQDFIRPENQGLFVHIDIFRAKSGALPWLASITVIIVIAPPSAVLIG